MVIAIIQVKTMAAQSATAVAMEKQDEGLDTR